MTNKRILVIGGSSGTGALIVDKLSADGHHVTVLSRNASKADQRFSRTDISLQDGDVTKPETLPSDMPSYDAVILTASVPSRPTGEDVVRSTEYEGTQNVLTALGDNYAGRFMYMNTIGISHSTWLGGTLNLVKGKTMLWRARAEEAIKSSGVRYTIIRAGLLNDKPAGTHQLVITPGDLPLQLRYRTSRADAADVFVTALDAPETVNQDFSAVWGKSGTRQPLNDLFGVLQPFG